MQTRCSMRSRRRDHSIRMKRIAAAAAILGALALLGYAAWYSFNRRAIAEEAAACREKLAHPTQMRAPDGSLATVYTLDICASVVVPPPLFDLIRGRMTFSGVPDRMKVNTYTLRDILRGRYTLGPADLPACDQSATTTDCSKLPPSQVEQQPYIPPNAVSPDETVLSAAGKPIALYGFSFELPAGWQVEIYRSAYAETAHALVQRTTGEPGFSIDCPPAGKGLEAATRLSSESRAFVSEGIEYTIAFERWTSPGNDPWYFVWVRVPAGTECLVQGTANPDIEAAMRTLYETWH